MAPQIDSVPEARDAARPWNPLLLNIYRDKYDQLVRQAMSIVKDRALAEDCVQDAILAFHKKQVQTQPGCEFAYVRSMVRNGAISKLRTEKRQRDAVARSSANAASAETQAISKLCASEIATEVKRLAPRQSAVIDLRLIGLSVAETAQVLSVSSGTVKTHRHRAAATLRSSLNGLLVA